MGVKWTKEQEQVISLRDRSILVSASAGSGKTAVLVQRILAKILDKDHPADIDRLLVMTFTRAAAGEMRERISRALEQALYEDPENEHLQKQATRIHAAQITTIDGFCAYVIRNYFHLIGLDPGYRTGDEGELRLLREDVLGEMLEERYAGGEEAFLRFVECYAPGRSDDGIRQFVLDTYEAAMSNPYPEQWLSECLDNYDINDITQLKETKWIRMLWKYVDDDLEEAEWLAGEARSLCSSPGGPYFYAEALDDDLCLIRELKRRAAERDYDFMAGALGSLAFTALSRKKMEDVQESAKTRVKELREEEKKLLREMAARYFPCREEELLEQLRLCREPVRMLAELALDFMKRFGEAKREKNILDFTDMEHFALDILLERAQDGTHRFSQAARELSEKYEEIMIDEYQDSNLVQELIASCVSGWAKGRKNIFMVGDVKQSIYRFRLARPELFMEKYKSYTIGDSKEQRIDLHQNFRSRPQVLSGVNYIFRRIMGEDLGGITYDDAAALYPGARFPEGQREAFLSTELLLVEKDGEELEEERDSQMAQELEALAIAGEIRKIVGKEKIPDGDGYRTVEYGDIAVLLRTSAGWADTFAQVFASRGIPAYTVSKTGYFSALEIVTVLNYLRICDNPLQDIPLAGVLHSPIVGCTAREMALIRCRQPEGLLYESVRAYAYGTQPGDFSREDEALRERLRAFLAQLEDIRDMAAYTPVHQLIVHILEVTGYGDLARALPAGEQRSANLHMLVEKAMDYEKTSYRGLFNFIRYVEKLQKYEVDFGEVNLSGAGHSAVQIMTIHKSKGLEFPVVFAAGMGKQFNFSDINARLLIHQELGLGVDAVLPEKRLIVPALYKQIVRRELLRESLGEELRVLYVALTRAREKLFLTGTIGKLEKQMIYLSRFRDNDGQLLPMGVRMKGKNFWSYVLPALAGHPSMDALFQEYGLPGGILRPAGSGESVFTVRRITAGDLVEGEVLSQTDREIHREKFRDWDENRTYDAEMRKRLEERFGFVYPYACLKDIPVKMSVSELKKRSYGSEEDREDSLFFERDVIPLIPRFVSEEEESSTGAARGTAYHTLMESLDYARVSSPEDIEAQIRQLQECRKLDEREGASISAGDIMAFVNTRLGARMKSAFLDGRLYREQPFVISRPARELSAAWQGEENVLIQGIIDAYFLEEEHIVLVDYKTDRVFPGQEQKLIDEYHVQLEDYAQALERMLGRRVKEKYIYSFALNKEIRL